MSKVEPGDVLDRLKKENEKLKGVIMAKRETVETLIALLCDQEGKVCLANGSEEDNQLLQKAIDDLKTQIDDAV